MNFPDLLTASLIIGVLYFWYRTRRGTGSKGAPDDTELKAKVERVLRELEAEYGTIAQLPKTTISAKFGFLEYQRAYPHIW